MCCSRILTSFIDFLLLWKAILANILSWIKFFGRTEREIQLECHLEIYPEFDRYLMWNWWFPAGFFSCKMSHLQANFCISEHRQLHSSKFLHIFRFDSIWIITCLFGLDTFREGFEHPFWACSYQVNSRPGVPEICKNS